MWVLMERTNTRVIFHGRRAERHGAAHPPIQRVAHVGLARGTCVDLPDWFVGAGAIRNTVWDYLHGYTVPTPLADVDVAFLGRS